MFITGAGISADSGLPTYRGIGGLYDVDDTEDGVPIEVALSGDMLRSRPELCWKHIARIEQACRGARPNAAHHVLARLERELPHVCVLTQNVDGMHAAAGSENVIAIHGDIHHLTCTGCSRRETVADYGGLEIPPHCSSCGALVRPEVVLFGEMLPVEATRHLEAELGGGFDLVFSIGTSSMFPYISGPVVQAARLGIPTVEINPIATDISAAVDFRIPTGAAEAMQAIEAART